MQLRKRLTGQVLKLSLSRREVLRRLPIRHNQWRDCHLVGRDRAVQKSCIQARLAEMFRVPR